MLWEGRTADEWADEWQVPHVVLYQSTTSTNDRARELANDGALDFSVVLADQQTAGRGQHGRRWISTPGTSVLLSVVLRIPALPAPQLTPLRIGLAVARAVENCALAVQLKWPNDVLIDGSKVGGILCEGMSSRSGQVVIAGIGLNVGHLEHGWPDQLRERVTSIAEHASVGRARLVSEIITEMRRTAFDAESLDPEELVAWHQRDALVNRFVHVDAQPRGTALGLATDGALRILTQSGTELIRNGTVRLVDGIS